MGLSVCSCLVAVRCLEKSIYNICNLSEWIYAMYKVPCRSRPFKAVNPYLSNLCYNNSLVTWTGVGLTITKFKTLILPMHGFTLSYFAKIYNESSLHLPTLFLYNPVSLTLSSHLCPGLASGLFSSGLPTKILYAFLILPRVLQACPSQSLQESCTPHWYPVRWQCKVVVSPIGGHSGHTLRVVVIFVHSGWSWKWVSIHKEKG